jgi:hypothetical protein
MSRRSGIRFADKDMRQLKILRRFPLISVHCVSRYQRKSLQKFEESCSEGFLAGEELEMIHSAFDRCGLLGYLALSAITLGEPRTR